MVLARERKKATVIKYPENGAFQCSSRRAVDRRQEQKTRRGGRPLKGGLGIHPAPSRPIPPGSSRAGWLCGQVFQPAPSRPGCFSLRGGMKRGGMKHCKKKMKNTQKNPDLRVLVGRDENAQFSDSIPSFFWCVSPASSGAFAHVGGWFALCAGSSPVWV